MQELLELILKNITTHPDEIAITQSTEADKIVFTIKVHDEDMGRVIGKDGKVIRAIRTVAHVAGIRANAKYLIRLEDGAAPQNQEVEAPQETTSTDDELIAGSIEV